MALFLERPRAPHSAQNEAQRFASSVRNGTAPARHLVAPQSIRSSASHRIGATVGTDRRFASLRCAALGSTGHAAAGQRTASARVCSERSARRRRSRVATLRTAYADVMPSRHVCAALRCVAAPRRAVERTMTLSCDMGASAKRSENEAAERRRTSRRVASASGIGRNGRFGPAGRRVRASCHVVALRTGRRYRNCNRTGPDRTE